MIFGDLNNRPIGAWSARSRWTLRATALAVLFLGIALTSCTTPDWLAPPVAPAVTTPAPTVIRINDFPYVSQAPLFIADEGGYLAVEGLQVEWVPGAQTEDVLPLLISGDLDVMGTAQVSGLLNALTALCESGYCRRQGLFCCRWLRLWRSGGERRQSWRLGTN